MWQEAKELVGRGQGLLLVDDTTLDKLYARKMELVTYHWSGKHRRVVCGINIQTLLWINGKALIPCDFRVYAKAQDGKSKNDHFQAMLKKAKERNFEPAFVLFDRWYASLRNLKRIRDYGWHWLTRLESNRLVNPDGKGIFRSVERRFLRRDRWCIKGYGFIKVFRTVSENGGEKYWATDDLQMDETTQESNEKCYNSAGYYSALNINGWRGSWVRCKNGAQKT